MSFMGYGYTTFLDDILSYRVCWFRGRQGGGKTSLAFRLGYELLDQGYAKHLVSNIPNVWNTRARDLVMSSEDTLDVVMILDEGGLILQGIRDAFDYLAALRKLNVYILIPSFFRPNNKVCFLDVQRLTNLKKVIGLPLWFYRYTLRDYGQKDIGSFFWWRPSEIYGVYSSKSFPTSDGGFRKVMKNAVKKLAENDREWWDDMDQEEEGQKRDDRETSDIVQLLHDTIYEMEEQRGGFEDTISEAERITLLLSKARKRN